MDFNSKYLDYSFEDINEQLLKNVIILIEYVGHGTNIHNI